MTIKIGEVERNIQNITLNRRNAAVVRRKLLNCNIIVGHPHRPVERVLSKTYCKNFRELRPHIHGRHCVQSLSIIPTDRLWVDSLWVNLVWGYNVSQIRKAGEILDEPSEVRACTIDICNSPTQLLLISIGVFQVLRDVILGV